MKRSFFLAIAIPLQVLGQSFSYPGVPMDLPSGARKVSADWYAALEKDDFKTVASLGSPFLSVKYQTKNGNHDFQFFRGFTYYSKFVLAKEGSREALDFILKAYAEIPEQGEVCYQAGHALLDKDRAKEALKPLRDAVRIYPFPGAKVDLAVALNGTGSHQEALDILQPLDSVYPENRRIRYEIANCLVSLHRENLAIPILEGIVRKDPKDFSAQRELAYVLVEVNRLQEALKHLEEASRIRPKEYSPWVEMVYAYLMLEDIDKAKQAFTEVKKRKAPSDTTKLLEHNISVVAQRKRQAGSK